MTKYYENKDHHFEAKIEIYPLGPDTRKTHPFNGIRWAFAYAEDFGSEGVPSTVTPSLLLFLGAAQIAVVAMATYLFEGTVVDVPWQYTMIAIPPIITAWYFSVYHVWKKDSDSENLGRSL